MRVLLLSINYWPEQTGIGAFTAYRAEYLASKGHDVTVCTTFPYYPEWKVPEGWRGKLRMDEERNGVRIVRSWAYIPNPVTSLKRILFEASFVAFSCLRALGQKKPDVLLVVSPPLGLAASAILLSRLWRIPYVFDVEDLQPDAAAEFRRMAAQFGVSFDDTRPRVVMSFPPAASDMLLSGTLANGQFLAKKRGWRMLCSMHIYQRIQKRNSANRFAELGQQRADEAQLVEGIFCCTDELHELVEQNFKGRQVGGRWMMFGFVAVTDGEREVAVPTAGTPLPHAWGEAMAAGGELRPYVLAAGLPYDYKKGVVGLLTNDVVSRDDGFAGAVKTALAPWVNPQAYAA